MLKSIKIFISIIIHYAVFIDSLFNRNIIYEKLGPEISITIRIKSNFS